MYKHCKAGITGKNYVLLLEKLSYHLWHDFTGNELPAQQRNYTSEPFHKKYFSVQRSGYCVRCWVG